MRGKAIEDMTYRTDKSKKLFDRALRVMVEGGSSPSRGPANYGAYPIFLERGKGSRVYDVDGNEYVDWMMAYGALPLGHSDPRVVDAIQQAASDGALFAAATEIEVEVAELVQQMVPSAERVRFANTGTEAAMAAIRAARGYTGRPLFIKFEGHYHGWYDDFLANAHPHPIASLGDRGDPVKIADSAGLNRHALDDTVLIPWNDLEAVERALDTLGDQIAAIITEGIMANMGVIPPEPGFMQGLREMARGHGVVFILDETVTGFRVAPGGCQELYGIDPDLSVFGKALGSGLPVAAIVGKAEIMDTFAWSGGGGGRGTGGAGGGGAVLHYGTQNASRIGLFAARAGLTALRERNGAAFQQMRALADSLRAGLHDVFQATGTKAVVQGVGPMFQIMFTDRPAIRDYREFCEHVDRDKYKHFAWNLFRHGVYMSPAAALHSVVTLAHTKEDVAHTIDAAGSALREGVSAG